MDSLALCAIKNPNFGSARPQDSSFCGSLQFHSHLEHVCLARELPWRSSASFTVFAIIRSSQDLRCVISIVKNLSIILFFTRSHTCNCKVVGWKLSPFLIFVRHNKHMLDSFPHEQHKICRVMRAVGICAHTTNETHSLAASFNFSR